VNGSARKWLKTREISQGCAFWGFVKNEHPTPHWLKNSENFALQKPFFAQNTNKCWRERH